MTVASWVVCWEIRQQTNRFDSPNPAVEMRCDSVMSVVGYRVILEVYRPLISQRICRDNMELTLVALGISMVAGEPKGKEESTS